MFSSVGCLVLRSLRGFKKSFFFKSSVFFLLSGWEWYSLAGFYTLRIFSLNRILFFKEILKKKHLSFVFTCIFTIFSSCPFFLLQFLPIIISVQPEEILWAFLRSWAVNLIKISCIWRWLYFVKDISPDTEFYTDNFFFPNH